VDSSGQWWPPTHGELESGWRVAIGVGRKWSGGERVLEWPVGELLLIVNCESLSLVHVEARA